MNALCWHRTHDVRVDNVREPKIENRRDARCNVFGHDAMDELVRVGGAVGDLRSGDRVGLQFCISCANVLRRERPSRRRRAPCPRCATPPRVLIRN